MSWGTCYKDSGCNNIDFSSPPMVSDGRFFTAYDSNEATEQKIKQAQGIQSNWEYREFLQRNATNIMSYENTECYVNHGLVQGIASNSNKPSSVVATHNTPFLYTSTSDSRQPPHGYCNSQLKNMYLSRNELNARLIAPSINLSSQQMER